MSRARTKVAEWWETSYDRSNPLREVPRRTKQGARTVARINGGKIYHVTRYRLAPLVKLVWRIDRDGELVALSTTNEPIACVVGCTWRTHLEIAIAETPQAAKAACAARLLELGYRVVDEKGGAR